MAKKMNNFLGHCFLSPSNSLVFLAKIQPSSDVCVYQPQKIGYSWYQSTNSMTVKFNDCTGSNGFSLIVDEYKFVLIYYVDVDDCLSTR